MTNKQSYSFKDIEEDPGLAFRLDTDEIESILEKYNNNLLADMSGLTTSTAKSRKEIASKAARVSSIKVLIDKAGKSIVDGWKKEAGIVDARRKLIREALEALRDAAREPLDRWAEEEAARQAEEDARKAPPPQETAQDDHQRPESFPATLAPEYQEKPATPQSDENMSMLLEGRTFAASRDDGFISFNDTNAGSEVFRAPDTDLGRWAASLLLDALWDAGGAVINTHAEQLETFDVLRIYGAD